MCWWLPPKCRKTSPCWTCSGERFRWKLWPRQATGDRKYGTEENLVAIESQHLHAYIPSPDNDHRTAYFSSQEFQYDAERDLYVCPAGKELHYFAPHSTERSRRYRARAKDCNHCPLKAQCTPGKQGRSLCRSVEEDTLDRVRAYASTEPYKKALRKRSVWVEPLFAEGKQWHGMRRFRLRRLQRVSCEALVTATGQNLKRLLQKRGWGRRPFPTEGALRPPAQEEPDAFPRNNRLKDHRASVAVASLLACGAIRMFFTAQTSRFSQVTVVHVMLPPFAARSFSILLFLFSYLFSSPEEIVAQSNSCILRSAQLGVFQQAGPFSDTHSSAFPTSQRITSTSRMQRFDQSQKMCQNQSLSFLTMR